MVITIADKSGESSPIVIDTNESSTESFSTINAKSRFTFIGKVKSLDELFNNKKIKDLINEIKSTVTYDHGTFVKKTDVDALLRSYSKGKKTKLNADSLRDFRIINGVSLISYGGSSPTKTVSIHVKAVFKTKDGKWSWYRVARVTIDKSDLVGNNAKE